MAGDSLQQARNLLAELLKTARVGAVAVDRLPEQLEALAALLDQAQNDARATPTPTAEADSEREAFLKEQAAFVSHAVHDLRTPMTSIRGYADMLGNPAMGELSDMQKQFVDTIRANARRMEGLLTDVSDMGKIRGNALKLTPKIDTFKNIALMVEKTTRPLAETMGKTLTFDIPAGLPLLEVDGDLLAKALTKLVENGLRYTREGGAVTVRASAGEGNTVVIAVSDNGIGMTPEEQARLGTLYFRADREEVRAHKGSGLGIPVAYGIIRLSGGTVSVESAPGNGTTFTITLPGMAPEAG